MKISVSLEKIACPRSRWLRGHPIFEIEYRYLREIENLAKPFLPIHMGPRSNFWSQNKKMVENLVTLSL